MSQTTPDAAESLSLWWRRGVIIILLFGFTVLIWLAARTYTDAPPIPRKVIDRSGATVFTRADIVSGQEVFLKYALMENGTIWGHGAYLGPDFSAAYLHALSSNATDLLARQRSNGRDPGDRDRNAVAADVEQLLKTNRYNPETDTLAFTDAEVSSYQTQVA